MRRRENNLSSREDLQYENDQYYPAVVFSRKQKKKRLD